VAAIVTLTALVAGVAVAHLSFLGAFALLWHPDDRSGTLNHPNAVLHWRNDGTKPDDGQTRRIGNLVHPGPLRPNGPIQKKVSEIFDRDEPPFFKNFLRLDVRDGTLAITPFAVTGEERGPENLTTIGEPIAIPLRPPGG
jgi:hypothetical protein